MNRSLGILLELLPHKKSNVPIHSFHFTSPTYLLFRVKNVLKKPKLLKWQLSTCVV
jgi:hypothetical protein